MESTNFVFWYELLTNAFEVDPPISYCFLSFHPPISYGFLQFHPPISYSFSCFYPPILLYLQRQTKRKAL